MNVVGKNKVEVSVEEKVTNELEVYVNSLVYDVEDDTETFVVNRLKVMDSVVVMEVTSIIRDVESVVETVTSGLIVTADVEVVKLIVSVSTRFESGV